MKKIFFVLLAMITLPFVGFAQAPKSTPAAKPTQTTLSEYPAFFVGLNGGLDFDINAHKLAPTIDGGKYFDNNPRYNIGADFGLQVSKKWRPRLELRYVNVKYGIDWTGVDVSLRGNPTQTIQNINYFDINLRIDYLLLSIKKFQFFVSPAFKYEFETGSAFVFNRVSNDVILHQPSSIIGLGGSAILKYNITPNWGITVTPEYTFFTHGFATGNSKPYERLSTNIGFEYKFGE